MYATLPLTAIIKLSRGTYAGGVGVKIHVRTGTGVIFSRFLQERGSVFPDFCVQTKWMVSYYILLQLYCHLIGENVIKLFHQIAAIMVPLLCGLQSGVGEGELLLGRKCTAMLLDVI